MDSVVNLAGGTAARAPSVRHYPCDGGLGPGAKQRGHPTTPFVAVHEETTNGDVEQIEAQNLSRLTRCPTAWPLRRRAAWAGPLLARILSALLVAVVACGSSDRDTCKE